jgi:hypothetical protein
MSASSKFNVDPNKIYRYLLSTHTPVAAGKEKFFHGIAGYSFANWQLLEQHLLAHPTMATLIKTDPAVGQSGPKRICHCHLPVSPSGKSYCIHSVWEHRRDGNWWFITAHPG